MKAVVKPTTRCICCDKSETSCDNLVTSLKTYILFQLDLMQESLRFCSPQQPFHKIVTSCSRLVRIGENIKGLNMHKLLSHFNCLKYIYNAEKCKRYAFSQGVESERCPSFTAARKAGKPVKIDVNQSMTLADGNFYRFFVLANT